MPNYTNHIIKHGHSRKGKRTRTYRAWTHMKDRCFRKTDTEYKNYGARGIVVCERWLKFENFLVDMGECPQGLTIDRINNDGNYEPGNCRWATWIEQAYNRRTNKIIEIDGVCKHLFEWLVVYNISYNTYKQRIKAGWPIEKAIIKRREIHTKFEGEISNMLESQA